MSLLDKEWVIQNKNTEFNLMAKLLENRGITNADKAHQFFNGDLSLLIDPYSMKDMDLAVERIQHAIDEGENMMIYGDYDVDGITATALLYNFKENRARVQYTLPHREKDGYGLKMHFIDQFKEQEVNLLVTVDCGTSNVQEIARANEYGIDVVVTDHHGLPEILPSAWAIVNPHQPDCPYENKEICGSTIAYKLVGALAHQYLDPEEVDGYLKDQLGLVALGIVGDCMALEGENRVMVKEGLKKIREGKCPGITALLQVAGISIDQVDSMTLGFQVGPRINAAGRIDHPEQALKLLNGDTNKAYTLQELNEKRRHLTKQYTEEAIEIIESWGRVPNIIVVYHAGWASGLLGLIASKIAERYGRPTIAMQEREDDLVASMRSVNDFNITESLREKVSPLCKAFGGHAMAGGLTLKKEELEAFLGHVSAVGASKIKESELKKTLEIDCEAKPEEISFEFYNKINLLEPFGASNPAPTLMVKNLVIEQVKPVGKEGDHLKMKFGHQNQIFEGIAFRFGEYLDKMAPNQPCDVAFQLDVNEWNGQRKLQLRVVDLKLN